MHGSCRIVIFGTSVHLAQSLGNPDYMTEGISDHRERSYSEV
jgi:hypothetical protein